MIRCVGAALRGDGNPPEVPVIRTVLRAYGVPLVQKKPLLQALMALQGRFLSLIRKLRKLNKFLQQIFFFLVTSAMGELGVKHDRARARLD